MTSDKLQALDQRLAELGVDPEELTESFARASGPGGQHLNRTATAVRLRHLPSGLEVRAESERSQLRNRIAAREQLIAKLEAARAAREQQQIAARERERRRRRRPSRAARAKMTEAKRRRGEVKRMRGRVDKE